VAVLRVHLEILDHPGVMAHREVRELQAHRAQRAHQAHPHHLWARRVEKDRKAARVAWVNAEMRGQPVSAEIAVIWGRWGILFQVLPVIQVRLGFTITKVNLATLVIPVIPAHQDRLVCRVSQAYRGRLPCFLVSQVILAAMALKVLLGRMVTQPKRLF